MKFLSPRSDISFKKLFANDHHKNLTKAFLNNVLNLSGTREITEIHLRETVNTPDRSGGKEIIFDVYCIDKHNNHYIIEMQSLNEYNFFERSQYYAARPLGNQLKAVEDYMHLLPVVFVGVVDYSLDVIKRYKRFAKFRNQSIISLEEVLQSSTEVITKYSFINKQTNQIIPTPLMELNFVELPKFKKTAEECITEVDQWLYLMKNADECDEIPKEMIKREVIVEAFHALERKNWSKEEIRAYVQELKNLGKEDRAREGDLEYAIGDAFDKGIQKEKELVVIESLREGLNIELIAKITGLSIEQIEILQTKLQK